MYLAEEGSKDVEFPEEDRFRLSVYLGSRYKVCGDPLEKSEDLGNSSNETNALPPYHHWQVTPPLSAGFKKERTKTHNPVPPMQPTSSSSSKKVNYENYFKRTIPLVTLGLDPSGKKRWYRNNRRQHLHQGSGMRGICSVNCRTGMLSAITRSKRE